MAGMMSKPKSTTESYSVPFNELNDQGQQTIWRLALYYHIYDIHHFNTSPPASRMTTDSAGAPYNSGQALEGDYFVASFFLYKRIQVPIDGPYSLHLSFYLKQLDTAGVGNVHNWELHVLSNMSAHPEHYLSYIEYSTDNHNQWIAEDWVVTETANGTAFTDQDIILLVGFRDAYSNDYLQQIEFYFTNITVQQIN